MRAVRQIRWSLLGCQILLGLAGAAGLGAVDTVPRCLILNSYHPAYRWTDDQVAGITSSLVAAGIPITQVAIEYLDAKRYPDLPYSPILAQLMVGKYRAGTIDCVVVTDNAALDYCLAWRQQLFPGAAIVFCGINGYTPALIAAQTRVTGIAEVTDIAGTLRLMLRLHPAATRVAVVYDQTNTGRLLRQDFDAAWAELHDQRQVLALTDLTFAELDHALAGLGSDTVVLLLSFASDRDRQVVEQSEEARLVCAASPVPVYALHENRLGQGIVGGALLDGRLHGGRAGRMVAAILAGADPATMPVDRAATASFMFDHLALARWDIPEHLLPAESSIINRPHSIWTDYRALVITFLIIGAVLLAIILALVAAVAAKRRAAARLTASERRLREDIAARTAAEAALAAAAAQWQATFDAVQDAIWLFDADQRIVRSNRAAEVFAGCPGGQAAGRFCWEVAHGSTAPVADCPVVRARSSRKREMSEIRRGERIFEVTADPVLDASGGFAGCVHLVKDVTAVRRLEESLRHTEKLNALGQLAGGVAHDFNNQLAGIMGFAELLGLRLSDQTLLGYVQAIITAAQRSADLTGKMLAFARKGPSVRVPVDVHGLIREVQLILTRSIDPGIRIEVALADTGAQVLGDPSQLQNALLNLCLNARDAMAGGGTLRIVTSRVMLPADADSGQPGGPCLRLDVSDTGCGMDDTVKRHLFEPFFTTKGQGKGTGMGLAAVYGTVRAHGGTIAVDSEVGTGTTFTLLLPLAAGAATGGAAPPVAAQAAVSLRILVVEDEPAIRQMLTQTLTAEGHQVQCAADGREAVRLYQDGWRSIDLVILDLIMPVMGGREAFWALKAINPRVQVLLATGFSQAGEAEALASEGVLGFLQKPFRRDDLLRLLVRVSGRP